MPHFVQEIISKQHPLLDHYAWSTWHYSTPFGIRICVCQWHVYLWIVS